MRTDKCEKLCPASVQRFAFLVLVELLLLFVLFVFNKHWRNFVSRISPSFLSKCCCAPGDSHFLPHSIRLTPRGETPKPSQTQETNTNFCTFTNMTFTGFARFDIFLIYYWLPVRPGSVRSAQG